MPPAREAQSERQAAPRRTPPSQPSRRQGAAIARSGTAAARAASVMKWTHHSPVPSASAAPASHSAAARPARGADAAHQVERDVEAPDWPAADRRHVEHRAELPGDEGVVVQGARTEIQWGSIGTPFARLEARAARAVRSVTKLAVQCTKPMPRLLAHFRLDAVLGLELRQELVGLEGSRPARRPGASPTAKSPGASSSSGSRRWRCSSVRRCGIAVQRLGDEHALALLGVERLELDLEGEAAQRRFVQVLEQVGGADEDAGISAPCPAASR